MLINCKVFLPLRYLPDSPLSLFREGVVDAVTFWSFAQDTGEVLAFTGLDDPMILPLLTVTTPPVCMHLFPTQVLDSPSATPWLLLAFPLPLRLGTCIH